MGKNNKNKNLGVAHHPNSRKTAQIAKKNVKASSREKSKLLQQVKQNLLGEKLLYFKEHLTPDIDKYTAQDSIQLIEKYLHRFDEELAHIAVKHSIGQRKNRQHASREDVIKLTMSQETQDFQTCGIECPDLMNTTQLSLLKNWTGELRFLQNFKLKRYSLRSLQQLASSELQTVTSNSTDLIL